MNLFQRPFSVDVENVNDADAQLQHSDLQSNEAMHDTFQENSLLDFYSRLEQEKYPVLLNIAESGFVNLQAHTVVNKPFQS